MPDQKATERSHRSNARASMVETIVIEHRGQWAVDVVVVFDHEVIRTRISTHRTRALAQLSADLIRRAAEREIHGPIHG